MKNIEKILKEKGALLDGHFLLSSGLHSARYVQCALVLQYPDIADALGRDIAVFFKKTKPSVVISPAMGGIIIGQSVAKALGIRAVFTEREQGVMTLRRGFFLASDDRVVVVEDVVTTGKSTNEVIDLVNQTGAYVCGVGCIIDRTSAPVPFPGIFVSLLKLTIDTYKPEECALCAKDIPAVKPGSRTTIQVK